MGVVLPGEFVGRVSFF